MAHVLGGRSSPQLCPELGVQGSSQHNQQGTGHMVSTTPRTCSAATARVKQELEMAEEHQGMNLLDIALKPEYRLRWTDVKLQGWLLIDKEIHYQSEGR